MNTHNNLSYLNIKKTLYSNNLLLTSNLINNENVVLKDISTNSNQINLNGPDIFIAYKGESSDGHSYIDAAIKNGAKLIIFDNQEFLSQIQKLNVNWILVNNSRKAWSYLEALKYDNPQNKNLKFIGITGTNGKTSTSWFVKEILNKLNCPTLLIGTIGIWMHETFYPTSHTTPDPCVLYKIINEAHTKNINFCVMEVSSHSLSQEKLSPIKFDAAAFTSFSRDHLDYHKSMEAYLNAKLKLFKELIKDDARCVFFENLPFEQFGTIKSSNIWIYGSNNCTHFNNSNFAKIYNIKQNILESTFNLNLNNDVFNIKCKLIGKYAIENLVAAYLLTSHFFSQHIPVEILSQITPPPGRMEYVNSQICIKDHQSPHVFVDYAHTPDALEKALDILKQICKGRLWVVFGCGGNRDKGKRPIMGNVAYKKADMIIVTSDNPRFEDPDVIISDILEGIPKPHQNVIVKKDRAEAIRLAIEKAQKNDVILIAGKGHEDYMIIKDKKMFFDDRVIAKQVLEEMFSL